MRCRRFRFRSPVVGSPAVALVALVALCGLVIGVGAPAPAAAAQPDEVTYQPPVTAPVVDPYRAPAHAYASGNRGIEYGTVRGDEVRAAARGRVVFAGPVAGALHVTVLHPDGLRTSYSFLESVTVSAGAEVGQGQVVGRAGGTFHFGVRSGDEYLDPALLFDAGVEPRLVPAGVPSDGARERAALLPLAVAAQNLGSRAIATAVDVVQQARAVGATRWEAAVGDLSTFLHYATELAPAVRAARVRTRIGRWAADRHHCTSADTAVPPPPERRVAVLVGGLGSSSDSAAIDRLDTAALGYADGDVIRFSYGGGRTPGPPGGDLAGLPTSTYRSPDTQVDMAESAAELLVLLDAVAAAAPGVPIDVFAHSQGGVVAFEALRQGAEAGRIPTSVDTLVTFGSPHRGADLATALVAIEGNENGRALLDLVESHLETGLDPSAPAAGQLAETSTFSRRLGATEPPPSVEVRSVAARGDLTVTAGQAALAGVEPTVIDDVGFGAHTRLPGVDLATREALLAVADRPPTCSSPADVVADVLVSESLSWAQDALGFAVWAASAP